jgi:hypothetical protein
MNDSVDAALGSTNNAALRTRALVLGALSIALGTASLPWFAMLRLAPPSTFPWFSVGFALAAAASAIAALRTRPRRRLASVLAVTGLVLSFAFPALVVYFLARNLNWNA